jgi:cellulose synthase/poly-beta-1,6-N-acetylglucosamine synthase-like glycosyltransferase
MIVTLNILILFIVGLLVYAWVGFYLIIRAAAERKLCDVDTGRLSAEGNKLPQVAVIISAYNEASVIGRRVRNLLKLNYPAELLRVYIGCDGCSDTTAEEARAAADGDPCINIIDFKQNRGKVSVLKDIVRRISEETESHRSSLLVFSDANTDFSADALLKLVRHFCDDSVGGVCGRLCFVKDGDADENPAEEGLYWRMETRLKIWESAVDSCLGANGAIYAIRPELFWDGIPPNTIVDDLVIGMKVRELGFRMLYDPEAVAREELPESHDEWGRRVRIGAGDYQALNLCRRCFSPRFGTFAWIFVSHKVLRWFTPHLLIVLYSLCIYLSICGLSGEISLLQAASAIVLSTAITAFLACGAVGTVLRKRASGRFSGICVACGHFIAMNAALFVGFLRLCRGDMSGTWKRTPRLNSDTH